MKEVIADITWQEANAKIAGLNTIGELLFHINYYVEGVLPVLHGGELTIRDKYSFDCPALSSATDWQARIDHAFQNIEKITQCIDTLPDEILYVPFVKKAYGDYYRNFTGMIEHSYYHLGQMMLLKKLIRSGVVSHSQREVLGGEACQNNRLAYYSDTLPLLNPPLSLLKLDAENSDINVRHFKEYILPFACKLL